MLKLFYDVIRADGGDIVSRVETEREALADAAYRSVKDGSAYVVYRCEMVNTASHSPPKSK